MKSKYFTPELARFLEEKGVLEKAEANFTSDTNPHNYIAYSISGAFLWAYTPEGWEFWNVLDKEFEVSKNKLRI